MVLPERMNSRPLLTKGVLYLSYGLACRDFMASIVSEIKHAAEEDRRQVAATA